MSDYNLLRGSVEREKWEDFGRKKQPDSPLVKGNIIRTNSFEGQYNTIITGKIEF